jgi:hypothetical protein
MFPAIGSQKARFCVQNLPYVKGMVSGLVALNAACDQAVHNKERCVSLSTYAMLKREAKLLRADRSRLHALDAAGSGACAPCLTESSKRTSSEVR